MDISKLEIRFQQLIDYLYSGFPFQLALTLLHPLRIPVPVREFRT